MVDETVLILGAGASCHCGYPTGVELIERIDSTIANEKFYYGWDHQEKELLEALKDKEQYKDRGINYNISRRQQSLKEYDTYKSFYEKLDKEKPVESIDLFLKNNLEFQEVGKRLIAYEMLQCEKIESSNRDKDWYGILSGDITKICLTSNPQEISKNKLSIITFNYDVSLEVGVYKRLSEMSTYQHPGGHYAKEYAKDLFENNMIHVYGSVHEMPIEAYGLPEYRSDDSVAHATHTWIAAKEAAKRIHVIAGDKQQDLSSQEHIIKAINMLKNAKRIFILGFGFDRLNTELLKLKELKNSDKKIFYTNYDKQPKLREVVVDLFGEKITESQHDVYTTLQNEFSLF